MLARELVEPFPVVALESPALDATRLLIERRLPGLIVVDAHGAPHSVLPGSQVLRFLVPAYVQEDPSLARVYDEAHADRLCASLAGRTVADLLPTKRVELSVVDAGDTALEIAAIMAKLRSPLVAVVDDGRLLGAITVSRLLERLLAIP
ncbi:CBS domain-containing protein [Sporichthya sp.]|uniref:CBS domain-containing protein n=1 Tax=Sporichthya sp. TaxID=65475 RepID=UPI00179774C9|nr:CBS domain-containing protein [Sporichthya sp.]